MSSIWNDSQPIYWQLKERTVAMILDGTLPEGEALPSVRTVASEFQLNPITVSKSYQALVDDGLVEKRRGLGMFVCDGNRPAGHVGDMDVIAQLPQLGDGPAHADDVVVRVRRKNDDPFGKDVIPGLRTVSRLFQFIRFSSGPEKNIVVDNRKRILLLALQQPVVPNR